MKTIIYIFFFLVISVNNASATTINWDGGGDQHTWTDPLNWDCNCLPGVNDYAVLLTVDSVGIPSGAVVHVNEILSYWDFTVSSGATLIVDDKIRLWFGSDFVNNGTININGEGLYVNDSRDIINNGTINFNGTVGASLIISSFGTDTISFINNGMLNWNSNNFGFLEKSGKTGFINQSSGSINFDQETNWLNNLGGTFINHGIIGNKGKIYNSGTFTNQTTGQINLINLNSDGILNNGLFTNHGLVDISNVGTQVCITNNWVWNSDGILNVDGKNILVNNHEMHLNGPTEANADIIYNGLVNNGDLFLGGSDYISTLNCRWTNNADKVMTIEACENVIHQGPFTNQGTLYNYGVFKHTHSEIPLLGTFSNHGIFYSNVELIGFPLPIMPEPSVNYGIHLKKIEGQQCAGTPIIDIFTGSLVNISQTPTGVFTNAGLTISAGNLDFANKIFTPNVACHGLTTLYISVERNGCGQDVYELKFALPIFAPTTYYADTDYDGYGDIAFPFLVECMAAPFGYSLFSTDCDDTNPGVYPGAPEICNDKDYNCDGLITGTNPAPTWYQDLDNDGYGNAAVSIVNCNPIVGYVALDNDCNDNEGSIHPFAPEVCNNIDDDCDGLIDEDFPPTTVTFDGSTSSDWFDATNWTPAMIPGYCVDVVIPTGMMVTAGGVGMMATCRSMSIATASSVSVNDNVQLNITGGTIFGIHNSGTLNFNDDSYTNIQYINGNGVENSNTLNMTGNAILYISVTSQSSIRNLSGGTLTINSNNGLDMNAATENAINNSGTINRNGSFNANNISGSTIKNNGTFNNQGDLFINAFGLPGWFVENLSGGIINNNAAHTWTFPAPGSFYNVSNMGLINHSGSTFNNYGTLQFFGHRIAGSGAFISYAGSSIEGCLPGFGCP